METAQLIVHIFQNQKSFSHSFSTEKDPRQTDETECQRRPDCRFEERPELADRGGSGAGFQKHGGQYGCSVQSSPNQKVPRRAMPQSAQHESYHHVEYLA